MENLFNENNYYWCPFCENYSMDLIAEDDRDWVVHKTYECVLCGEKDFETVDLD